MSAMRATRDDYHHHEQARAYPVLGELLERGRAAGLPAATWTVTWTGVLWATTDCRHTDPERRADFDAWVDAMDARSTVREDRSAAGDSTLRALVTDYAGTGVTVGVRVDLDGPRDEDEAPTDR